MSLSRSHPTARGQKYRPCLLAAALLAAGGWAAPAPMHAQGVSPGSVEIAIDVVNGLSVFRERHLNFGAVVAGSGVHTVTATSPNAGLFRVYGRRNRWVDVTLTPPANLSNGTHTIPFTAAASANEEGNVAAEAVAVGNTFSFRLREFVSPSPAGQAWVWIHGQIDVGTAPSALSAGLYTGIFTLHAVYQ
jgi:hypothetical protein